LCHLRRHLNLFEKRAFEDRWKGGINNYVAWMKERLAECYRILKPTGTMFLHCDHHASHCLKVEMDALFGENNFVNEIIWQRQFAKHSDAKQKSSFSTAQAGYSRDSKRVTFLERF